MYYGWRNEGVYPGGTVYVIFPKGQGGSGPPVVPPGWKAFYPAKGGGTHWARSNSFRYAWGIAVPANATPGTYSINSPSDGIIYIEVKSNVESPYVRVSSVDQIQNTLNGGWSVELLPGRYELNKAIRLPDRARIRGYGARLVRTVDSDYAQRMFVPAGEFWLEGLTLSHEIDQRYAPGHPVYIHNASITIGHGTVKNCVVENGALGHPMAKGFLVEGCTFLGASANLWSGQVWRDNLFTGLNNNVFQPMSGYAPEGSLVVSNVWRGTSRGIFLQNGDSVGNVFMDLYFNGVRGQNPNSNEVIMMEAGTSASNAIDPVPGKGIRDNAFLDISMSDCAGQGIELYGTGMHSNIFAGIDLTLDRTGIHINALTGKIGKNLFQEIQTTGGLLMRGAVGGQEFVNVTFLDRVQGRGTQGADKASLISVNAKYPIDADTVAISQPHKFSNCGIIWTNRKYSPIETPLHSISVEL